MPVPGSRLSRRVPTMPRSHYAAFPLYRGIGHSRQRGGVLSIKQNRVPPRRLRGERQREARDQATASRRGPSARRRRSARRPGSGNRPSRSHAARRSGRARPSTPCHENVRRPGNGTRSRRGLRPRQSETANPARFRGMAGEHLSRRGYVQEAPAPAAHARLRTMRVIVRKDIVDDETAGEAHPRGFDSRCRLVELLPAGQQRRPVGHCPAIILDMGDLEPVGAEFARQARRSLQVARDSVDERPR